MNIRHFLHSHPELSGQEHDTHDFIYNFISQLNPDCLFDHVGGFGIVASFYGNSIGKNIAIRCDIDALPINEDNILEYKSICPNVSHKCGHDGHTAILLTLAEKISAKRPKYGNVIFIFQPEEETGYGAKKIIDSGTLDNLNIDIIFGFHNIPGFPEKSILVKNDTFAAASCGLIANITGRQTHAAHPENGINPGLAVAKMINLLNNINIAHQTPDNFQQATLIYTRIGEIAFGTSAGDAEVMTTLRAFSNKEMKNLVNYVIKSFSEICIQNNLILSYKFQDNFLAVENDNEFVDIIRKNAVQSGKNIVELDLPFRWSEDFSNYLTKFKGAFFGIGDGVIHAELHSPTFDFPDSIISPTADFLYQLIVLANK